MIWLHVLVLGAALVVIVGHSVGRFPLWPAVLLIWVLLAVGVLGGVR